MNDNRNIKHCVPSNNPKKSFDGSEQDNINKPKKKKRVKDIILIAVSLIIVTISLVSSGFVGVQQFYENPIFEDPDVSLPENPYFDEKVTTFLILGIDYEPGTTRAHLTDVNMLMCLDNEKKTMSFLQIQRDSYVGDLALSGKFNAIYGAGTKATGVGGVAAAIEEMFKINIDYYITMNMKGFREIVDAMGGIELEVPRTVSYGGYTIQAGKQTLTGKQAEIFVRVRKAYSDGDFGRMNAQRIFMAAMFEQFFKMKKSDMIPLIPPLLQKKYLTTNLSLKQMDLIMDVGKQVKKKDINIFSTGGVGQTINGHWSLLINQTELCDILNENFRPYSPKYTVEELNIRGGNLNQSTYQSEKKSLTGNDLKETETEEETTINDEQ